MDLFDIHKFIDQEANKSQNGWFTPEEKDRALHQASLMLYDECFRSYALSQDAQDDLAPFKKAYNFTNANSINGLISLPDNYQHFLGGYVQLYDNVRNMPVYQSFDVVNDDELADRISSQVIPISTSKPVGQWAGKGKIQLWPKQPSAGYVSYLKFPDRPELVYLMDGREIVYDGSNSSQLEWDELNTRKIIMGAIQLLGITIDADKLIQITQGLKQ